MDPRRLNYLHLLYLRTVIREGSIRAAAEQLHVTPQTISGQLRRLEDALGVKLLQRRGRGVAPTEYGRLAMAYADEIFRLGDDLVSQLAENESGGLPGLHIGINALLPRLLVRRVLAPVLDERPAPRLDCVEGARDTLLRELTARRLDAVLSAERAPAGLSTPVISRELIASPLAAFGTPEFARRLGDGFPGSLDGAPLLLPSTRVAARAMVDDWFASRGITPGIVGEFDDAALSEAFGEIGAGIFLAPAMLEDDIRERYRLEQLGRLEGLDARVFLLTAATGGEHPAIGRIIRAMDVPAGEAARAAG